MQDNKMDFVNFIIGSIKPLSTPLKETVKFGKFQKKSWCNCYLMTKNTLVPVQATRHDNLGWKRFF